MAVRGLKVDAIDAFRGIDSWTDADELPPNVMSGGLNVVVNPNANITALRSPANFNTALSTGNKILSAYAYNRAAGTVILFDISPTGTNTTIYYTTGTTNSSAETGLPLFRKQGINFNDRFFLVSINGGTFRQVLTSLVSADVGITAPAAAPTISFVAGGTLVIATGVTVSYAYRNSTTGHVGEASAVSAASGTSGANGTLRVAVTASTQTGVDGIVLFITEDGGSRRYLRTDSAGAPIVHANTTGNIDITAPMFLNFNVKETEFNAPPPSGITHLSNWKSRLVGAKGNSWYYSGFDQIEYGNPWESWPPLNRLPVPNLSEIAQCGIETPVGWLGFTDINNYLLTGTPTDKVDSGENTLQVTEHLQELGWNLGTRSPLTVKNTPYGTIWLDHNKHLQLWNYSGAPEQICIGLSTDLAAILDTDAVRSIAEGEWYQYGDSGGFYALTACTSGSANNRMWFVTIVRRNGQLYIDGVPSDIAAQCVTTARLSGKLRAFIGVTDRLREVLDFSLQGAGWGTASLYAEFASGNKDGIFGGLHSINFDGSNARDFVVQTTRLDGTFSRTHNTIVRDGQRFASVNRYGIGQKIKFVFPNDDTARYELKNIRVARTQKRRVI